MSGWAQSDHKGPCEREAASQRRDKCRIAGFEDGRIDHKPKNTEGV